MILSRKRAAAPLQEGGLASLLALSLLMGGCGDSPSAPPKPDEQGWLDTEYKVDPDLGDSSNVLQFITLGSSVYARTRHGDLFLHTNGKRGWEKQVLPNRGPITSLAANQLSLFAGVGSGDVYRLDNQARSWVTINTPWRSGLYPLIWDDTQGIVGIAFTLYSGENLFIGQYNGANWRPISVLGLPDAPAHFASFDSTLFVSALNGIFYKSVKDSIWDSLPKPKASWDTNTGLKVPMSLCTFQGDLYAGYFGSGVYRYKNGKEMPIHVGKLNSESVDVLKDHGDYLYCSLYPNGILRLRKDASDWQDFTPLHDWCCGVNDFAFVGDTLYAAFGTGRILSLDLKRLPP